MLPRTEKTGAFYYFRDGARLRPAFKYGTNEADPPQDCRKFYLKVRTSAVVAQSSNAGSYRLT
jgi:hypothetical protein